MTTKKWTKSTTANTNPYFLSAYNLSNKINLQCYILGSSVDVAKIPQGYTSNISYPAKAIQLPSGTTTTNIRSGYNSNSSMVIKLINPQIYRAGFYENNNFSTVELGNSWIHGNNFYEY